MQRRLTSSPCPEVAHFREVFAHPVDPIDFGVPISCTMHYPVAERGQRRHWVYEISYARRRETHTFSLPCPSLPIEMSRLGTVAQVLQFRRQPIKKDCEEELEEILERITRRLRNRSDEQFRPTIEAFFRSLPLDDCTIHESYYDVLADLSKNYGNEVYVAPEPHVRGMIIRLHEHLYCFHQLFITCILCRGQAHIRE